MPTPYPKCSPTEMMGLLVLLNSHSGSEDIARLAQDLDLEIDEILPAIDFGQVLGFLEVADGQAKLTPSGKTLLAGSIRARKGIVREQLERTTLYKALLRALESAPEHRLTEEQVNGLIAFTTAPSDALTQNIINWGRYAEMFRYDPDEHLLLPVQPKAPRSGGGRRSPPITPSGGPRTPPGESAVTAAAPPNEQLASIGSAGA